jgi:hypothetical protein
MLLFLLIIPLAVGYLIFTLALRDGATGGTSKYRGVAEVSGCSSKARMLGLLQQCRATDVVLGPNYPAGPTHQPSGDQTLVTRDSVHGRIAVVEKCSSFAGYVVTSTRCTLYPATFPRSVWWSWLGYLTIPIGIFVYFSVRASADNRRFRSSTGRSRASLYLANVRRRKNTDVPAPDSPPTDTTRSDQP